MASYAYINTDTNVVRGIGILAGTVDRPDMIPIDLGTTTVEPGYIYNGDGTFSPPPPTPEMEKLIAIGLIWTRMTDTEQDQIIAAEESGNNNARRFITGLQVGGVVKKGRIYPIVEGVWGAARAAELLADEE